MKRFLLIAWVVYSFPVLACAATYDGQSLDGQTIPGTVFSQKDSKTYDVKITFAQTDAIFAFRDESTMTLTLETDTIADPHHIRAYSHTDGAYWEIDLTGMN
jgi:hypothetical protein